MAEFVSVSDTAVESNGGNFSLSSVRQQQLASRITPVCFQPGNLIMTL